jgi:hypothetical protein
MAGTTEALIDGWVDLGKRHVYPMIDACQVLAAALDAAAGYVVGQKAVARRRCGRTASATGRPSRP